MNERHGNPGNEGPVRDPRRQVQAAYWKRAHRDWRFWAGLVMMLAAITIFALSSDLVLLHHR
jgi:hypothetical protein